MSKKPINVFYDATNIVATLEAYVMDNEPVIERNFFPCLGKEATEEAWKKSVKENAKTDECLSMFHVGDSFYDEEWFADHFNTLPHPKLVQILSAKEEDRVVGEYWGLVNSWEFVDSDLSTDDGKAFMKALLDAKSFGTETEDPEQKWNVLWQLINLGNTISMAYARSYERGCVDTIPFYAQYLKDKEKAENGND